MALVLCYLAILVFAPVDARIVAGSWFLPAVGVLGATIANTSGTGGGVVFVPVFNALRHAGIMALDPAQVVAASFLIQCFGMSMGALRWSSGLHRQPSAERPCTTRDFWRVVRVVLAGSLPAMLATQRLAHVSPHGVLLAFKAFSVVLGLAVIVTTWTINRERPPRAQVLPRDFAVLVAIGLLGGCVTALFSVGVGELMALYLFIRHYPVVLCTGTAVVVSSLSMLAGAPFHILAGNVAWTVVVLAGPGAALGGVLAQPLALWLGANRLKTLDGCWIVASSLYLIVLNV